jgi:hypothetical protein
MSSSMSMPQETKSPPDAQVFGQNLTKLTVKILRSIFGSYELKLKAQELRRDLLKRVVRLENRVSEQDRRTISKLLEDKVEVTHAAIIAGREYDESSNVADDEDEEDEQQEYSGKGKEAIRPPPLMAGEKSDESKRQLCNTCLEVKPSQDFREGDLHPNCPPRVTHMCEECVKKWINTQLSSAEWQHTIPCPFTCQRFLPADVVVQYGEPALTQKYQSLSEK